MIRRVVAAALVVGLVSAIASPVWAQAKLPKGTAVKLDGKVEAIAPGKGLLVAGSDGKKYALGMHPASKLSVTGTATPDFLGPGAFVQFDVDLDGAGKPTKEVTKIQITEPSPNNPPGITSEAGPDAVAGAGGKFFVRGHVKSNKSGALTVQAGEKAITVQVSAAAAAIPVTFSDWRMAKVGDTVSGSGVGMKTLPNGFTPVYADNVTIKAVMPFQGNNK